MSESVRERTGALSIRSDSLELFRIIDQIRLELDAVGTTVANIKAIYDAHTHECPGSSHTASRCSTPDAGAAENSLTASAASAITDSTGNYALRA